MKGLRGDSWQARELRGPGDGVDQQCREGSWSKQVLEEVEKWRAREESNP